MKEPTFDVKAVRERMAAKGVTVSNIAEATGKTRAAVYKWFDPRSEERNAPKFRDAGILAQLIAWPLGALAGIETPRSMRYKWH